VPSQNPNNPVALIIVYEALNPYVNASITTSYFSEKLTICDIAAINASIVEGLRDTIYLLPYLSSAVVSLLA